MPTPSSTMQASNRVLVMFESRVCQKDGSYAGFDSNEFTSKSGGKAAAVQMIKVTLVATECA